MIQQFRFLSGEDYVRREGKINLRPKIVIAGAGFGGLWAARRLAGEEVEVLVVDRNNYHTFLPLLY